MAVLVSQNPSTDRQGVFFRRPDACPGRFWTGEAWRSPVPDRSGSAKSVRESILGVGERRLVHPSIDL